MVMLRAVTPEQKEVLWNLLQKYLYEMSRFYGDSIGPDGNFPYQYFDCYFTQRGRQAYLIERAGTVVGFAMLNAHSYLGRAVDHVLAEFTIFPGYRRNGCARQAVQLILDTRPGRWELKYAQKNSGARALWLAATQPYAPERIRLEGGEEVLAFTVP